MIPTFSPFFLCSFLAISFCALFLPFLYVLFSCPFIPVATLLPPFFPSSFPISLCLFSLLTSCLFLKCFVLYFPPFTYLSSWLLPFFPFRLHPSLYRPFHPLSPGPVVTIFRTPGEVNLVPFLSSLFKGLPFLSPFPPLYFCWFKPFQISLHCPFILPPFLFPFQWPFQPSKDISFSFCLVKLLFSSMIFAICGVIWQKQIIII